MKQAIGYVRVSTEKQASEGVSLDAQIDKIKAWATLNDYELIRIYNDEGITGTSLKKRSGLQQALSEIKPGQAFVCYSLSRLSRSIEDTLKISNQLDKLNADLISLSEKIDTTGAAGRMIFNMLAVLNQFERDQIAERTKSALDFKKKHDQVYGHAPYGYDRVNDELILNEDESQVIQIMANMKERGQSYHAIAKYLNEKQIPTKQGKIWRANTVYYILKRSKLVAA